MTVIYCYYLNPLFLEVEFMPKLYGKDYYTGVRPIYAYTPAEISEIGRKLEAITNIKWKLIEENEFNIYFATSYKNDKDFNYRQCCNKSTHDKIPFNIGWDKIVLTRCDLKFIRQITREDYLKDLQINPKHFFDKKLSERIFATKTNMQIHGLLKKFGKFKNSEESKESYRLVKQENRINYRKFANNKM